MARTISDAGKKFIEREEGLRLQAYKDTKGIWTIGYGSTSGVQPGMIITQQQAEEMLEQDLLTAENAVNKYVKVAMNDNEFTALVSFTFNLGSGNFQKSTLLRCLNMGNRADAGEEFLKWDRNDPVHARRQRERVLFLTPA
jgi:lysozyme